jgi:hypothetical protein
VGSEKFGESSTVTTLRHYLKEESMLVVWKKGREPGEETILRFTRKSC